MGEREWITTPPKLEKVRFTTSDHCYQWDHLGSVHVQLIQYSRYISLSLRFYDKPPREALATAVSRLKTNRAFMKGHTSNGFSLREQNTYTAVLMPNFDLSADVQIKIQSAKKAFIESVPNNGVTIMEIN